MSHDADHRGNGHPPWTLADAESDIGAIEERLEEMDRAEERRTRDEARLWEHRQHEMVLAVASSVAEIFVPRLEAIELALATILAAVRR